jgi:two-component system chemotaxis response regulator CheB
VRFSRPSIDVTFLSAADSYGHRTVGVVLTGANADGSEGLRRISDRGGMAVVQDPATAESALMPTSAMNFVPRARVMPMIEIVKFLAALPAGDPQRDEA